jgi:hypothetical protein
LFQLLNFLAFCSIQQFEIHEDANVEHDFDEIDLLFTEINEDDLAPRLVEVPVSNGKPPNQEIGLNPELKMIAS